MVLKNLNDLSEGLQGDVKVIYKVEDPQKRKNKKGLYTKKKYVFADLKEGREQMLGREGKMEMIYKLEKGKVKRRSTKEEKEGKGGQQTPNIYEQQTLKSSQVRRGELSKSTKKDRGKFLQINEKRIRVSGFKKDKSLKRGKLMSNRKLSSISKMVRERRSNEKSFTYKSNLKGRMGMASDQNLHGKEKVRLRESFGKERRRSESKLGILRKRHSKTNIYQKAGPEIDFPKSEIEFKGRNVQNSIYIKSEEIKPDEGTTISEKTENSLACKENIEKTLEISQSPEPFPPSERRGRQSTKHPTRDQEGNTYFELGEGGMDYAKSEDLEAERRAEGGAGKREEKERGRTSLEDKGQKKMKLSQSDAGNWKKMKVKFKEVRSGDFDLPK